MADAETDAEDIDCDQDQDGGSIRRPMNAFLIFCKRHRSLVRDKYPHLENRSITKILGEWWASLEPTEKATYTDLAKQYKDAFMRANPDFRWYKLPAAPVRTLLTRPANQRPSKTELLSDCSPTHLCGITPGKLADETQLGGLNSLIAKPSSPPLISKPPKKRYLENGAFRAQEEKPPCSSSDSQTSSACSALLELASMCSTELKEKSISSTSSSSSVAHGTLQFQNNSVISPHSPCNGFSLCKEQQEKRVSHQQLINCIIENSIGGSPVASNTCQYSPSSDDDFPKIFGGSGQHEPKLLTVSSNSNVEVLDVSTAEVTSSQGLSGSTCVQNGVKEISQLDEVVSPTRRKSERKGKGNRYQALISEGILQPVKERKASTSCNSASRKLSPGSADEEEKYKDAGGTTRRLRKRSSQGNLYTPNQRQGDFDLEEQIAALPRLNIDALAERKKQRRRNSSSSSGSRRSTASNSSKDGHEKSEPVKDDGGSAPYEWSVSSTSSLSDDGCDRQDHGSEKLIQHHHLVGSQKRKARKRSITHLDPSIANKPHTSVVEKDVLNNFGLTALAEVAISQKDRHTQ